MSWAEFNGEPPCAHIVALRELLESSGMSVTAEHSTDPDGWVNVHCSACTRTYETVLREPYSDDPEESEDE